MKKFRLFAIFAMVLVSLLACPFYVYAYDKQNNVLDVDVAVNKAIENAYSVKNREYLLENAKNRFKDNMSVASSIDDRLKNNDRFIQLEKKTHRNEEEEREYKKYLSIYGVPVTDDYKLYQLIKLRNNTPVIDQFDIFQYTSALDVEKNSVKQLVYEKYCNLLKLKEKVDLEKRKMDNFKEEYNKGELSKNLGILSKVNYLVNKSGFLKQKELYNKLEMQLNEKIMEFNKLTGEPLDKKYCTYIKDFVEDDISIKKFQKYLDEALKNRIEIKNGEEYIKVKRFELGAAMQVYKDEDHRERRAASLYMDNAKDILEIKKIDIKMEINNLYNDVQINLSKLEGEKENYIQAKKDYNEVCKKYNLGLISKLDFEIKSVDFIEKSLAYKNLQRDLWLANLKLEFASSIGVDSNKVLYGAR